MQETRPPYRLPIPSMILAAILSAWCFSAGAQETDETSALRAENARLKAQVEALKSACRVEVKDAPVAKPPKQPASSSAGTPPAPPSVSPEPPKYLLVPAPEPHSQSGCGGGLFARTADAPWKHAENWADVHRGDTPAAVEKALGSDHYDLSAKGREVWQFGKCGTNVQGTVVFENGGVLYWTTPEF